MPFSSLAGLRIRVWKCFKMMRQAHHPGTYLSANGCGLWSIQTSALRIRKPKQHTFETIGLFQRHQNPPAASQGDGSSPSTARTRADEQHGCLMLSLVAETSPACILYIVHFMTVVSFVSTSIMPCQ